MQVLVFRRWSNKKWAILASFHKVIIIGTLCFSNQILGQEAVEGHKDTLRSGIMVELEEVEASGEWPADLEDASLKPVILVTSTDISSSAATSHEDMLEYLPQVDIRQRGRHGIQADLSIQGSSFDQSMVLLNGINMSDPQTGHFQLNLPLDLYSIHHMEVITGSATRRLGANAFAGAVNVVTRPGDSTFFNAGFRVGQHKLYNANLKGNLGGKYISTLVSLNTSGSNGYRENTDFKTTRAFIHTAAGRGKLKTQVMAGMNTRAFGANSFYSPLFIQQYEETTTGLAALKMDLSESRSQWALNAYLKVNRDHFLLDRSKPTFYVNDHLTRVTGTDLSGAFSTVAGITQTGLHYRGEQISSTSLGEPFDPDETVRFNDTITFTHGHQRNQFNWNLNHTYERGRFSLSGGFMVHMNSDLDYRPGIFPGMDIRMRLPASFRIFSSLNQSMRLPTFTDLYYQGPSNVGNPALTPEKASTLEWGIYRDNRGLRMGINGFYRQGKNLIDWIWMEDEKWHTMNLTRVDAMGGDILFHYRRPEQSDDLFSLETAEFSYSFTHLTRVSGHAVSLYLLDNLRHKVVLGTGLRITGNLLISLKVSGQDRNGTFLTYDTETGQSVEKPFEPFILMDLKLDYGMGRFHIFLEATNLLDAAYNDIGNVIQPGRWFLTGVEIR